MKLCISASECQGKGGHVLPLYCTQPQCTTAGKCLTYTAFTRLMTAINVGGVVSNLKCGVMSESGVMEVTDGRVQEVEVMSSPEVQTVGSGGVDSGIGRDGSGWCTRG